MPRSPIGTFEKDGVRKDAYTPAEAVSLKFDGWKPVTEATPEPAPQEAPPAPDTSLDLDEPETKE